MRSNQAMGGMLVGDRLGTERDRLALDAFNLNASEPLLRPRESSVTH